MDEIKCSFCLEFFSPKGKLKKYPSCSKCRSLSAHYDIHNLLIDRHEYYKSRRPKIDLTYILIDETIRNFGYSPLDLSPFSIKKISAVCKFCNSKYETQISTLARKNWTSCCIRCASFSSSLSKHKQNPILKKRSVDLNNININETLRIFNFEPLDNIGVKSMKKCVFFCSSCSSSFESTINKYYSSKKSKLCGNCSGRILYDHNNKFFDDEKTFSKFGYHIVDLKLHSNKKITCRCEFCDCLFDRRYSSIYHSSFISCQLCSGISSLYSKVNSNINKHQFYVENKKQIDYSKINTDLTFKKFNITSEQIFQGSRKKIVIYCSICNENVDCSVDYFVSNGFEVSCKKCIRIKTINTLKSRYGVSNVLDIPHVKDSYTKSSIEKIVENMLKDHYKINYTHQYTVDAGLFQYSFDFFIPSINLLIECQGDYFHNFKENGYSGTPKDKSKSSYIEKHTNYKLVHIWEHEIHLGRLKKILDHHILGSTEHEINVNDLSSLSFKEVSSNDAHLFLSSYHYLGNIGSSSRFYGAYHNDVLICLSSFGSLTRSETVNRIKKHVDNSYISTKNVRELRRFCIRPNVVTKNLASYSLSRFISLFSEHESSILAIISFSDSSVGDIGTIYKASNWKFIGKTTNSYHYLDLKTNKHIHKKTVWNYANKRKMSEKDFVINSELIRVTEGPKSLWAKLLF